MTVAEIENAQEASFQSLVQEVNALKSSLAAKVLETSPVGTMIDTPRYADRQWA